MDSNAANEDITVPLLDSYLPLGDDYWTYAECEYGDLHLEESWRMTNGLYWNTEVGQGPDSWGI